MALKVVVIDDQLSILESMKVFFGMRDWEVLTAPTGRKGLRLLTRARPDLVVLDIKLPDMDGLVLLKKIRDDLPETQVIMITAHQDMENTIYSIKLGAFDFIHKPIDLNEMDAALRRLAQEKSALAPKAGPPADDHTHLQDGTPIIIGKSRAMKEVFKTIAMVSESRVTVLILGESGTGKELIAKAIHHQSPYHGHPFMVMDCSTFVDTLLESELFGYEKGAFTGAESTHQGRLEMAGQGTIFFDEIGELPLHMQSKLLRFLNEKEFYRVGGSQVIRTNARILAATNRNLSSMVEENAFREDLYFRLKVVTIKVPPLRERRSDIPILCTFLLKKIAGQADTTVKRLAPEALRALEEYHWPGNVRQLENTLTRAAVVTKSQVLTREDIRQALHEFEQGQAKPSRFKSLAGMEKDYIFQVLKAQGGHLGKTCEILGTTRPTLRAKMKKYGIAR